MSSLFILMNIRITDIKKAQFHLSSNTYIASKTDRGRRNIILEALLQFAIIPSSQKITFKKQEADFEKR